jgi:hypothetical protein
VAAWHINLAVMLNDQKRHEEARTLLQVSPSAALTAPLSQ